MEGWDNLRDVFINKSKDLYQKQNDMIVNKNEYINENNLKIVRITYIIYHFYIEILILYLYITIRTTIEYIFKHCF